MSRQDLDAEAESIYQMYVDGMVRKEVARRLNTTDAAIASKIVRYNRRKGFISNAAAIAVLAGAGKISVRRTHTEQLARINTREVLKKVVAGESISAIADDLGVTSYHLRSELRKRAVSLGLETLPQLIAYYYGNQPF